MQALPWPPTSGSPTWPEASSPSRWSGPPLPPQRPALTQSEAYIIESLAELKTGQILNRKAGAERLEQLADHVDARIMDLRHTIDRRMDRIEDRVTTVETRQHAPAQPPPSSVPAAPASPPSTPPPWWREMSIREWLIWAFLIAGALGWLPSTLVEPALRVVLGAAK